MPPERNAPSGTSLRIRSRTASVSVARSSFCQRSGDQAELAVACPFPFEFALSAGGPSAYGGVQ